MIKVQAIRSLDIAKAFTVGTAASKTCTAKYLIDTNKLQCEHFIAGPGEERNWKELRASGTVSGSQLHRWQTPNVLVQYTV